MFKGILLKEENKLTKILSWHTGKEFKDS
jgi:hypothetical protein